jgi:uncharacterized repeat protein (TIGR03803 family)
MRLLWAAVLVLSACVAQAGVVFTTLYSFPTIAGDGGGLSALVQGTDGNFYGTSFYGGENRNGTVFKIGTKGVLTRLHSFTGTNDGLNPQAGLVQGSDGYFYGTTYEGGTNSGFGTVFKVSTNGVLTSLHSFGHNDGDGIDGDGRQGGLVQGSDGSFYGTTSGGGTNICGSVFKISTNGALTTLHSFLDPSFDDGAFPATALQPQAGN